MEPHGDLDPKTFAQSFQVRDEHIREAMHELTVAGGTITKSLLGASDSVGGD